MQVEQGEWILNERRDGRGGRGLRPARPGPRRPARASSPPGGEAEAAVKAFSALDPTFKALAERFLKALADPKKVVHFHNVVADEQVSRCLLAWHPDMGGAWVSLARSGDLRRISLRSEPELRFLVANALAADDALRPDRIAVNLSTPEALALLAILDQLRRARLISLLDHKEPVALFAPEDVQARLGEADVEDFRWTLPFLAKLLPLSVGDLAVTKDPRPALLALEKAGLVERVGVAANRVVCELTPAGDLPRGGVPRTPAPGPRSP